MNIYSLLSGFSRDSRVKNQSFRVTSCAIYLKRFLISFLFFGFEHRKEVGCRDSVRKPISAGHLPGAMHSGIYRLPNPLSKSRPIQKSGGFTT